MKRYIITYKNGTVVSHVALDLLAVLEKLMLCYSKLNAGEITNIQIEEYK